MSSPTNLPATNCLDHIIYLSPPGSLRNAVAEFENFGFRVLPGGQHADGLTENALVVLADGVYIELISFIHPPDFYPPGSPERQKRDSHWWANKDPGWIDFCFLDNLNISEASDAETPSNDLRVKDIINDRTLKDVSTSDAPEETTNKKLSYVSEVHGGRVRPDGVEMKWMVTFPMLDKRGVLPFFCKDLTPRERRVPTNPPSNIVHPSTAVGISFIRVAYPIKGGQLEDISRRISHAIGNSPEIADSPNLKHEWELDAPYHAAIAVTGHQKP
ncbi:hypothetical protein K435DRAFT_721901, partial [Dendrothele bispora CBS 962.96]